MRCVLLLLAVLPGVVVSAEKPARTNVLLITVDDMNFDSLGCTGCKTPGVSPHVDKLASEGMLFEHAHVTIAVCQPCRSVWFTGRFPHRNGARGFEPIAAGVPTLTAQLKSAGYFNGIMAKVPHLAPQKRFAWDVVVPAANLRVGRDPALYYKHAKAFFAKATAEGKPFFLMANSQDPHRPFVGSRQEQLRKKPRANATRRRAVNFPEASRHYKTSEVAVPGFLPDIPDVRKEIAQYYSSVHRADEIVGAVLKALDETGRRDNTLVMFLSDHGMPLPFAKTNCYRHSTRTPWIVRWPGVVKRGVRDANHMVAGIDLMPTVLDALGVKPPDGMDGRSFLPVLKGQEQAGRNEVYTLFFKTAGKRNYPMRSVVTKKYGYIYNGWADGKTVFRNESQAGLTMKAMRAAAESDAKIAARVKLFLYRVPEELYDYENDPDALHNLIDDPKHADVVRRLRTRMLKSMQAAGDPLRDRFAKEIARNATTPR